ncbi:aminoglycoside phosphotransferase [Streptomyces sp. NPDC050504]|uniref:aminoglycoside phosphotransferase n=1 Tax=Streptomyces sp. NPDC050504 TaxID=3365618 RepID=UPI003793CB7D
MPVDRVPFAELPGPVREAVARRVGACSAVDTAGGGNCAVAAVLTSPADRVFVKGIRSGHDQADELDLEYRVGPYLPDGCPRVRWRTETAGWVLVAFDAVAGEHADYRPGAADLEAVVRALTALGGTPAPPVALLSAGDRWGYYCAEGEVSLLAGDALLHTDLAATNVLVRGGRAHVVDWAWAARGAAWIDAALWAVRLVSDGGHTPAGAARWARRVPAFRTADPRAVAVLGRAEAARWADLRDDGVPGIERVTRGSRAWAAYWTR